MTLRRWIGRYGLPGGSVLSFAVVALVMASTSDGMRRKIMAQASTNIANLGAGRLDTLATSAFVAQQTPWEHLLTCATLGLALTALVARFGNRWAVILVVAAHVIGSVVSESVVGLLVAAGVRPRAEMFIVDVGPSYVLISAMVAVVLWGTAPFSRVACLIMLAPMLPSVITGLLALDVTSIGHLVALVTGLVLGRAGAARVFMAANAARPLERQPLGIP